MYRVAIIPARSGSKRVPHKNIADLCGKPMIVYSIEAAKQSGLFDRILVSTDSEEYAAIAQEAGAEAIIRPPELATDVSATYDAIKHTLETSGTIDCDYFVLLQPTSPLRTAEDIVNACQLFDENLNDADYVVSVKPSEKPSYFTFPIEQDNSLKNFQFTAARKRRQDYKEYTLNGAVYIARPATYLESANFFGPRSLAYKMSSENSVDVDSPLDLELARLLLRKRNQETE